MREKNNDEENLFYNADSVRGADRNARHLDEGFEVVDLDDGGLVDGHL